MKTKYIWQVLLVSLLYTGISAEIFAQSSEKTIYIKSSNFTQPILKTWIEEYSKINAGVDLKLADRSTKEEAIAINVVADKTQSEDASRVTLQVARYAILPVANKQNPILSEINKKGLDKNKIARIFFEKDVEDEGKYPFKNEATIYSGNLATSNSAIVSQYFEKTADQFKGKKIAGDDIYLINAVSKDETGVAFNYLSYIYDIQTRQLKENVVILPIDIKKDQWEAVTTNIDETLAMLENQKVNLIPVEPLILSFASDLPEEALGFVEWIVTDGQKFNHQYGFLNIDPKQQDRIQKQINYANLLNTNNSK